MSDRRQGGERSGQDEFPSPPSPDERGGKKPQAKRKVIIEKPDVERPSIGKHRQAWEQEPRRTPRNGGDQRKRAPKKDEHAERHQDFLRRRQPEQFPKFQKEKIE